MTSLEQLAAIIQASGYTVHDHTSTETPMLRQLQDDVLLGELEKTPKLTGSEVLGRMEAIIEKAKYDHWFRRGLDDYKTAFADLRTIPDSVDRKAYYDGWQYGYDVRYGSGNDIGRIVPISR